MKFAIALVALVTAPLAAFASPAEKATLCGRVNIESSRGMLAVMVYQLHVPAGPMLPAFSTYEIVSQGTSLEAMDIASEIIGTLRHGEQACFEGYVSQGPNYINYLMPSKRVR